MPTETHAMTPAEAKAALIAAFPDFTWGEPVAPAGNLAFIKGRQGECIIAACASPLGYRFQYTNSAIGLLLESLPDGEYSQTLADAIASLRQAAAEQMRSLEVLQEKRLQAFFNGFASGGLTDAN